MKIQLKEGVLSHRVGSNRKRLNNRPTRIKNRKKHCFRSPFVANRATNGNRNSVSNDFLSTFVGSIDVFDCRLPGVIIRYFCVNYF